MSVSTGELRTLLADGPTDKRSVAKKCVGMVDGANKRFITFEPRRVTNFQTGSVFPFGVYIDGVLQTVAVDDPESGVFELATAPLFNKTVEATYFSQWFIDTQLAQFLLDAAVFVRSSSAAAVPDGLKHAALKYAAAEAYQALALYWSRQTAETFKLNDALEKDRFNPIKTYGDMANNFRKEATTLRDDYYERSGQQKQPLWGFATTR